MHPFEVAARGILLHQPERRCLCVREDVEHLRVRIERAALPIRAAGRRRQHQRGERAFPFAHHGRREDRTELVARCQLQRFLAELRREVDEIVDRDALPIVGRRLGNERLRRRIPFAGNGSFLDRPFFDRPHRFSVRTIEHVQPTLLGRLHHRLDLTSIHGEVREDRRARDIHVPDAVMNELVVPLALTGFQIERDEALAEQTIPRTMTAVVIAGRQLHRKKHGVRLFVDRHLRPDAGVPRIRPRIFFPRVVAEFTGLRNRVEDPQTLSRACVVAADETLFVNLALRSAARQMRGADDDDVLRDDRRRVESHFSGDRIDLLIVVHLQIDDAVRAK